MSDLRKGSPYYDGYDSKDQYTQLLAVPGRVAQAREITEMQSTIKDIVKNIGDILLSEGSVLEGGCQPTVRYNSEGKPASVTISAGKVYINGMVLPVAETNIDITGEGEEVVGLKLRESIITESDDPRLLDPATGYANHQRAGCHRLKSTVEIVLNDPSATPLVTLMNGVVTVEKYAPNYSSLNTTLARRTRDESGSYIVKGLKVRVTENIDPNYCNVVVEPGLAYVEGYELPFNNEIVLKVPRATEYVTINPENDQFVFGTDKSSYLLDSDGPYVKAIKGVRGYRYHEEKGLVIIEGTQQLYPDHRDIQNIQIQYTTGGVLEQGKDYEIITNPQPDGYTTSISWMPHINHDQQVNITYVYRDDFYNWELVEVLNEETGILEHHLRWTGIHDSDSHPDEGTTFKVIYEQYLARKDIVYLDQDGNLGVVEGKSADYGREVAPQDRANSITLAVISHPPGGLVSTDTNQLLIYVNNTGLTRFTMRDIQRIVDRLKTIEYDQAILSLESEARNDDTPSKKGIWTDPLVDYSRLDLNYLRRIGGKDYKFDATLDFISNICYMPTKMHVDQFEYDSTTQGEAFVQYTRAITLASIGESVLISQPKATDVFYVNPYSKFPQLPEISISPASDSWIESNYITVPKSVKSSEVVSTTTRNMSVREILSGNFSEYSESAIVGVTDTEIGTRVSTTYSDYSVISESAVKYIRPQRIAVRGSNFDTNLRNFAVYFDGIRCTLMRMGGPTPGYSDDREKGTIVNPDQDFDGSFEAYFVIPGTNSGEGVVPTGIREVRVVAEGYKTGVTLHSDVIKSASALYQATGLIRTYQRTMTTLTTILLERVTEVVTTTYVDPVGQTFVLNKSALVKGIDLYFADPGRDSVTCEIREVVNGSITSTVYAHKTLSYSEISPSGTATRFNFEDPVLLESMKEYAFVVRSASSACSLWVAKLGGLNKNFVGGDIVETTETVLNNPYLIGVMLSSSNNSTWTAHQDMDIKFDLYADVYADRTQITLTYNEDQHLVGSDEYIEDGEGYEFSRLYLLAESSIPSGTDMTWEYRVVGSTSHSGYRTISPHSMELLNTAYSSRDTEVEIRLTLENHSGNENISPILVADSVYLAKSVYDSGTGGTYVSAHTSNLAEYSQIKVLMEEYIPNSNTNISVFAIVNETTAGEEPTLVPLTRASTSTVYGRWVEREYTVNLIEEYGSEETDLRILVKMTGNKYSTPAFRRLRAIVS